MPVLNVVCLAIILLAGLAVLVSDRLRKRSRVVRQHGYAVAAFCFVMFLVVAALSLIQGPA